MLVKPPSVLHRDGAGEFLVAGQAWVLAMISTLLLRIPRDRQAGEFSVGTQMQVAARMAAGADDVCGSRWNRHSSRPVQSARNRCWRHRTLRRTMRQVSQDDWRRKGPSPFTGSACAMDWMKCALAFHA